MMIRRKLGLFTWILASLCMSWSVHAQQVAAPATLAVHAGRLIDVHTGKVSQSAYIIIAKDRILRVADSAPAGIQVLDLSHYTVVPGLIDAHAHVLGNLKDQSSTAALRMSSAQKAVWGGIICKSGWTTDLPLCVMLVSQILRMGSWLCATTSKRGLSVGRAWFLREAV